VPAEDILPIRGFLLDSRVTEITINGPDSIYVEVDGKMLLTDRTFTDENHLMRVIEALAGAAGQRIDPERRLPAEHRAAAGGGGRAAGRHP
jgi:Flp pilus assembly CpaF family ATPase